MITDVLEVLPQEDYLDLASTGLCKAVHQELNTYESITMMLVPEWYRRLNIAYCSLTYFGKAHGKLIMHLFTIGRNFLVTSHENKAEWSAIAEDLKESCIYGIGRAKRTIQAKRHSDFKHYFRFYYASNLDLVFAPSKRTKVGKQLHHTHDDLDSRVKELEVSFAPDKHRTRIQMVTNDYICEFLKADDFEKAYQKNRRFIFELRGKDVAITPALLGGIHGLAESEPKSPMEIAKVSFLAPDKNAVTEEAIAELELLIASKATKEADLQKFFECYPALLCDERDYVVHPQIVFSRDDSTILRPDFFLEPMEGILATSTVLDIKRPTEKLILNQKNRPRFYAKIYEYAAQLREYSRYMESPSNRKWIQEQYGIRALQPHMVLVVGKDYGDADYALVKKVQRSIHPIEIRTYSEILELGHKLLSERPGIREGSTRDR